MTHPSGDPTVDTEELARAAALLRAGRLVAFPTETVYGLGANALDAEAVRRIFAAKGRPANIPLIVHLADAAQLATVTSVQPAIAQKLATAFWPGPLTMVLPRSSAIPDVVTAGLDTVGVRVPAHPLARALIEKAGVPVAAPSANPFTQVSPTTAAHVRAKLGDAVDLVLDGGPAEVGIESTVVDACGSRPVLLRPGGVSVAQLEAVVGPVERPLPDVHHDADGPRPSPGTSERHYAPRARLVEVRRDASGRLVLPGLSVDEERWALISLETLDQAACDAAHGASVHRVLARDPVAFARELFAALHQIDDAHCGVAFVEALPDGGKWEAVADRLRRAGLVRRAHS